MAEDASLLCGLPVAQRVLNAKTLNSHHRFPSQHLKEPKREHPNPVFNNPGNIFPSQPAGAGLGGAGAGRSQAAPRPRMPPGRLRGSSLPRARGLPGLFPSPCPSAPGRSRRDRGEPAPWAEGEAAAALQVGSGRAGGSAP